jgi:hypothetical protein
MTACFPFHLPNSFVCPNAALCLALSVGVRMACSRTRRTSPLRVAAQRKIRETVAKPESCSKPTPRVCSRGLTLARGCVRGTGDTRLV